jgi:methionyl-tRNA formyltransferase
MPVLQPDRIKRADTIEQIRTLEPDVIVVMAYGQILPAAILAIPRIACLNLHASLLPRHRGAAPTQAAIAAGDTETGITVIYMDEGLDTGDILLQSRIPIAKDETGGSLHDRLAEIAPATLSTALSELRSGTAPRTRQNSVEATYAPKLERENGEIDWSEPVQVIERKIRAFDPWPGSYSIFRDEKNKERKLKIFRASISARKVGPGEICVSESGLVIGASDAGLLLEEVQLEGKNRMSGIEFARGHKWVGTSRCDVRGE